MLPNLSTRATNFASITDRPSGLKPTKQPCLLRSKMQTLKNKRGSFHSLLTFHPHDHAITPSYVFHTTRCGLCPYIINRLTRFSIVSDIPFHRLPCAHSPVMARRRKSKDRGPLAYQNLSSVPRPVPSKTDRGEGFGHRKTTRKKPRDKAKKRTTPLRC